ncbi:MAG: hypothetical protein JO142_06685 [Burkholderiales bacterium]|nr:hypothetical protein [Burkholderiales bacterium]
MFEHLDQVAVTSCKITSGDKPVLLVTHDVEGWMFLTGERFTMEEAQLVSVRSIIQLDPSLSELADLSPNCSATRDSVNAPWVRIEEKC